MDTRSAFRVFTAVQNRSLLERLRSFLILVAGRYPRVDGRTLETRIKNLIKRYRDTRTIHSDHPKSCTHPKSYIVYCTVLAFFSEGRSGFSPRPAKVLCP